MERSKKSHHRRIYLKTSGWPARSSPNTTNSNVFMTLWKQEGVGSRLWWTVFLAVNLWSGFSRWAWLRTVGRQCSTGHGYNRVGCYSTSRTNTASRIIPFIIASWHKTQETWHLCLSLKQMGFHFKQGIISCPALCCTVFCNAPLCSVTWQLGVLRGHAWLMMHAFRNATLCQTKQASGHYALCGDVLKGNFYLFFNQLMFYI